MSETDKAREALSAVASAPTPAASDPIATAREALEANLALLSAAQDILARQILPSTDEHAMAPAQALDELYELLDGPDQRAAFEKARTAFSVQPAPGESAIERARAEGMDEGATFVLVALAKDLGVARYEPCDGTDDWRGDVVGTLWNILCAGKVFDPETSERCLHPPTATGKSEGALSRIMADDRLARARSKLSAHELQLMIGHCRAAMATAQARAEHDYWMPGDPDCPREIKAPNGELHTLRCKVCGVDNPRGNGCLASEK